MSIKPRTTAERQRDYLARLDAAGKKSVRIVLDKDVARRLRELAHQDVAKQGAVLAKAIDALERQQVHAAEAAS